MRSDIESIHTLRLSRDAWELNGPFLCGHFEHSCFWFLGLKAGKSIDRFANIVQLKFVCSTNLGCLWESHRLLWFPEVVKAYEKELLTDNGHVMPTCWLDSRLIVIHLCYLNVVPWCYGFWHYWNGGTSISNGVFHACCIRQLEFFRSLWRRLSLHVLSSYSSFCSQMLQLDYLPTR